MRSVVHRKDHLVTDSDRPAAPPPSAAYPPAGSPSAPNPYATNPYAPPRAYQPPAPTGRVAWALGFLAYIPLPVAGLLLAAIVVLAVYPSQRRKGSVLAAENARGAANWALTVILVLVLCALWVLVLALSGANHGFFPIGVAVIVYLLLGLAHAVVTIVGTVVSGRRVFRNPLGIPFIGRR